MRSVNSPAVRAACCSSPVRRAQPQGRLRARRRDPTPYRQGDHSRSAEPRSTWPEPARRQRSQLVIDEQASQLWSLDLDFPEIHRGYSSWFTTSCRRAPHGRVAKRDPPAAFRCRKRPRSAPVSRGVLGGGTASEEQAVQPFLNSDGRRSDTTTGVPGFASIHRHIARAGSSAIVFRSVAFTGWTIHSRIVWYLSWHPLHLLALVRNAVFRKTFLAIALVAGRRGPQHAAVAKLALPAHRRIGAGGFGGRRFWIKQNRVLVVLEEDKPRDDQSRRG